MLNVDTAQIQAKGGNGGNGCIAFRREKFVPRGGPNGGDGGKGGDVILESIEGMTTLIDLKYQQHQRADNGQHGMGKLRNGKDANDRICRRRKLQATDSDSKKTRVNRPPFAVRGGRDGALRRALEQVQRAAGGGTG